MSVLLRVCVLGIAEGIEFDVVEFLFGESKDGLGGARLIPKLELRPADWEMDIESVFVMSLPILMLHKGQLSLILLCVSREICTRLNASKKINPRLLSSR